MHELKAIDPNYETRVRTSFDKQAVMSTLGAHMVHVAPGEVVIEFHHDPSLTQQNGYIHAGVVTTVVDSACGYAAYTLMPADSDVLTIEYKVNFMAPAKGEVFKAVGKVLRSGRTITVCCGDVLALEDGKERVVATMLATMITVTKPTR
ncbi:MAG: PaaI family thioesterase [Desulfuromonadales bacterium]|nr:PaaI family thioesterase [Desulfuromonadales bacterium]